MTAANSSPLLDVTGLALVIGGRTLIDAVSFAVRAGETWCVLGANGAGKTLLLHTLAGLRPICRGDVALAGTPLPAWRMADAARVRAFLPQLASDAFPMQVQDAVMLGRHPHLSRWTWEGDDELRRAHAALAAVGLSTFATRDVTTLSGGERQRVAIATLLAQDTPLMLLDEPLAHLDLRHQLTVLDHFSRLVRAGRGVMLSLHDLNLASRFATHVLMFDGAGHAIAGSVDEVMTDAALSAAFACQVARVAASGRVLFVAG
jgi:iron complex transport system ATP-binding protein